MYKVQPYVDSARELSKNEQDLLLAILEDYKDDLNGFHAIRVYLISKGYKLVQTVSNYA